MSRLLTPAGRLALPRFEYRGTDHSLIYRLATSHIADALVHRCTPRWLAPNAITFAGLGRVTAEIVFHDPIVPAEHADRKALARHCHTLIAAGYRRLMRGG